MSKKNLPSTRKDLGGGVYLYRDPGTSVAQLQVAQAELPPPEQAFMADAFGIDRTGTRVEIGFCQRALGGAGGIGAAVMISVPLSDIRALLYENSVDFFAQLQRGCASRTANDDAVLADYANVPVDRVIKERANLLAMAYTGDDAEVRFYKIAAYIVVEAFLVV